MEKPRHILAIDSSSTSGSIALFEDGRLVSEWTVGDVGTHADWLTRNVSALLESSGREVTDVDLFALSVGPGSFTGLRIGVSTVKGLAWTTGRPVSGVSTLAALSMNLAYTGLHVCPVLDARKKEVYSALYRVEGTRPVEVVPDGPRSPEDLVREVADKVSPKGVVFLGSGLNPYGEYFSENLPGASFAPEPLWHVRASCVARLAVDAGETAEPAGLLPRYMRKSEAEIKAARAGKGA